MTREEEILSYLEDINPKEIASHIEQGTLDQWAKAWKAAAEKIVVSALRPVNREQVEQMRGVWIPVRESEVTGWDPALAGYDPIGGYVCSQCKEEATLDCNDEFALDNFCPHCGAPMTDEAVEMVMKRMEALYNA